MMNGPRTKTLVVTIFPVLLALCGCGENNEARIEGGGTTPPNAASTSEAGLKVQVPITKAPYGSKGGYGAKEAPVTKGKSGPQAEPGKSAEKKG
jgi:hypothetical protein